MKKLIYLFLLLTGSIGACTKTDSIPKSTADKPTFSALSPSTAKIGETITLTGTNFGTNISDIEVGFKTLTATINGIIKSSTISTIVVEVPAGTVSGNITVKVKGIEASLSASFIPNFTVTQSTSPTSSNYTQVITFAGGTTTGSINGIGTAATFWRISGLITDAEGNLFVADMQQIRKITPNGLVSTYTGLAGGGNQDGTLAEASFTAPTGLAFDLNGDLLVADPGSNRIRRIAKNGTVSTVAGSIRGYTDGTGTSVKFENANTVAVDANGNIFVGDQNKIRKITPAGVVSTFAGTKVEGDVVGAGVDARFRDISFITFDSDQNLLVCDANNGKIKKINKDGVVSNFVQGLNGPFGIAIDKDKNLYVPEAGFTSFKIRKITSSGLVSVLAGSGAPGGADGTLLAAQFYFPNAIAIAPSGVLYVGESTNYRIRKIY